MENPLEKIRESRFFLDLMTRLELTGKPLVDANTPRAEMAYLLSAFLNSVYATTEHLKPAAGVPAVQVLKGKYPLVFHSRSGMRNLTVHEKHIEPSPKTFIPSKGRATLVFSGPRSSSNHLVFRPRYYFGPEGAEEHIVHFCAEVQLHLERFSAAHGYLLENGSELDRNEDSGMD